MHSNYCTTTSQWLLCVADTARRRRRTHPTYCTYSCLVEMKYSFHFANLVNRPKKKLQCKVQNIYVISGCLLPFRNNFFGLSELPCLRFLKMRDYDKRHFVTGEEEEMAEEGEEFSSLSFPPASSSTCLLVFLSPAFQTTPFPFSRPLSSSLSPAFAPPLKLFKERDSTIGEKQLSSRYKMKRSKKRNPFGGIFVGESQPCFLSPPRFQACLCNKWAINLPFPSPFSHRIRPLFTSSHPWGRGGGGRHPTHKFAENK